MIGKQQSLNIGVARTIIIRNELMRNIAVFYSR